VAGSNRFFDPLLFLGSIGGMKQSSFCWCVGLFLTLGQAFCEQESLLVHSSRPLQAESTWEALESWETPISGFFIRSHHDVPVVDPDSYTILINGLVENPLKLTLADLKKFQEKSFHAVLECSGNKRKFQSPPASGIQWEEGAVGNAEWSGVSLSEILAKAKPKPEAKFITVRGADKPALPSVPEFVRSIPIGKALDPQTLLALKMNREVLPLLHGGPVRLVLPGWYAQNWIKWVTEISLTAEEDQGFYMKKAYRMPIKPVKPGEKWDSQTGTPVQEILVQSLIVSPKPGERVALGRVTVKGKAFSGAGDITQVELSLDGGRTWKKAQLFPPHSTGGWQEFKFSFQATKARAMRVLSRATDKKGNVQPLKHSWNPPGYLRNSVAEANFWMVSETEAKGYQIYKSQCLICHSSGIVESQKIDAEGWKKTISKMKVFGANLEADEEKDLLAYLVKASKQVPLPFVTTYEEQKARFSGVRDDKIDFASAKKIFEQNCALCHGIKGEGSRGPRLRARIIPKEEFVSSVSLGKNSMPAFESSLSRDQIVELWNWLQRSVAD